MRIFVDIDGTLTHVGGKPWGPPRVELIAKVKKWIEEGHEVVLWSACGRPYVEEFARRHGIVPFICLGKPDIYVDDHPEIRGADRMRHVFPVDAIDLEE